MVRFLKRLFEKEWTWIRSRLGLRSRRLNRRKESRILAPKSRHSSSITTPRPTRSVKAPIRKERRQHPLSPARGGPLQREIATTPSDPFSAVVASVILHGSLLLVLIPLLFPEAESPPVPRTFVIRWEARKPETTTKQEPVATEAQEPVTEPSDVPIPEPPLKQEPVTAAGEEINTDVAGVGAAEGSQGSGRRGDARGEALRIHGGNSNTEDAVGAGLLWLMRHQDQDGSWSPDHFDRHCEDTETPCNGAGYPEHRAGITALALLALLGNGSMPDDDGDPSSVACNRALQWLLDHKDPSGCIRTDISTGSRNLYDHGIATFALCEAAELTGDPAITEAARSAIYFLESSQQPAGGWDYTPSPSLRNDLSITGWQVLAIHAGIEAGILPSARTIRSLERYLDRAIDETGHAIYSDRGRGRGRTGFGIDAVGLLTRLSLGHSPVSAQSLASARRIAEHPPRPEVRSQWDQHPQSMYYWYTATLALFHVGGSPWKKWNQELQQKVLQLQIQEGESIGSWPPDPNWIGAAGGRVAQTALGVLTFETYYRYTPLHQRLGIARNPKDR